MFVIGLTGGVATGKSTVAAYLRTDHEVAVIDADQVARDVVRPGSPCLQALVQALGEDILLPDGALNRALLRQRISDDASVRSIVEGITHPAIRASIATQLQGLFEQEHAAAVVEAALLVETGSHKLYDALIVVSCDGDLQLQRLCERDQQTPAQAQALIAAQMPLAEKEKAATIVIRNDGTLELLREATAQAWTSLIEALAHPN